jgi:predicted ribonuclease YlaK
MEEKMSAWLLGVKSNLKFLYDRSADELEKQSDIVYDTYFEPLSLENIQGVNLHNSILLVDEYTLTSVDVLKQVLSRIAKGSKVVLIGDRNQTYGANRGREGYKKLLPYLKDSDLISFVRMDNIYRSELAEFVEEIFG